MSEFFVLPVSGGSFPHQLGISCQLLRSGFKPDVMLGSSGGNVTSYILAASDYNVHSVSRIIDKLHNTLFCKSWWPSTFGFMPSWLLGNSRGSIFDHGAGARELYNELFTPSTICNTEIWTGTLNRNRDMAEFFCNRSQKDSILGNCKFNDKLYNCMPRNYLNGNIDDISVISEASASIPVIVPDKIFRGNLYTDGGTVFASPLTPFITSLESHDSPSIHITYINCVDVYKAHPTVDKTSSLYVNGSTTLSGITKSLNIQDRTSGILFINNKCNSVFSYETSGNIEELMKIKDIKSKYKYTFLELYPNDYTWLDVSTFVPNDVKHMMAHTERNYSLRFWYGN